MPAELFEVQGFNVYGAENGDHDEYTCSFFKTLSSLSESHVKAMAGNAMHLRVLAAILLFTLGCTKLPESS